MAVQPSATLPNAKVSVAYGLCSWQMDVSPSNMYRKWRMPAQQAKSSQSNAGSNFLEQNAKGCHGEEEKETSFYLPMDLRSPVHVVPPLFMSYRLCSCRTVSVHVVTPLFMSYRLCEAGEGSGHKVRTLWEGRSRRLCGVHFSVGGGGDVV
jgi:hypothetical protein